MMTRDDIAYLSKTGHNKHKSKEDGNENNKLGKSARKKTTSRHHTNFLS